MLKRYLYNLKIKLRLFGIVIAFLIPISALTYFLVDSINANIRFSEMEIKGNRYEKPLMNIFNEVADHRLTRLRMAEGIEASKELEEISQKVDEYIKELISIDKDVGIDLKFTKEELASRKRDEFNVENLSSTWQNIKSAKDIPLDSYAKIISIIRGMITHAGDTSNLILDPDLDSYYLMDITLLALPQTLNRMSDIALMLYPKLSKQNMLATDEKIEVTVHSRMLKESDFDRITADLDTVLNEDPNFYGVSHTLKSSLDPAISVYKTKVSFLIDNLVSLAKDGSLTAEKFAEILDDAHDNTAELSISAMDELDILLNKRIESYKSQRFNTLLWCGIAQIIALFMFWFMTESVTKPLERLQEVMTSVKDGVLDTEVPGQNFKDEIGSMARCVESFRQNALEKKTLEDENKKKELLAQEEKKKFMNEMANSFEKSVKSVVSTLASSATELSQTSRSLSGIVSNSSNVASEASATSKETNSNVQAVASATEEFSSSAKEISSQIQKTNELVQKSVEKTNNADSLASALNNASSKINSVMDIISTIAEQTNLLALNATIEASRAGEVGKGFAVVAGEVKNLANQTDKSINDIQSVVKEMNVASNDIISSLRDIRSSVSDISFITTNVASAVEEQSSTTNEIARNMQMAAKGTNLISSRLNEVTQSSSKASDAASQLQIAADSLSKQSEDLTSQVTEFLSKIRNS